MNRTAYVPLKGGELVAIGLDTGVVRWKVEVTTPFTPATGDGFVFAAGDAACWPFTTKPAQRRGARLWAAHLRVRCQFDAGAVVACRRRRRAR